MNHAAHVNNGDTHAGANNTAAHANGGSQTVHAGDVGGTTVTQPPTSQRLELFVHAGKDGESYGGCPMCQRLVMVLLTKAEFGGEASFVVTPINIARPPDDFKKFASRLPAVADLTLAGAVDEQSGIVSDPDELIQYIDRRFRYPPMSYDNIAAAKACRDIFSKFSFYIKDVSHSSAPLIAELHTLNMYLVEADHEFLSRDGIPDHLDCMLLPKLQHVRVAAKAFKDFDIPFHLTGVWRYLADAYRATAFRRSCPSDQEIVFHWQCKPECPRLSKEKQAFYSTDGTPRYSFDVPSEVQLTSHKKS